MSGLNLSIIDDGSFVDLFEPDSGVGQDESLFTESSWSGTTNTGTLNVPVGDLSDLGDLFPFLRYEPGNYDMFGNSKDVETFGGALGLALSSAPLIDDNDENSVPAIEASSSSSPAEAAGCSGHEVDDSPFEDDAETNVDSGLSEEAHSNVSPEEDDCESADESKVDEDSSYNDSGSEFAESESGSEADSGSESDDNSRAKVKVKQQISPRRSFISPWQRPREGGKCPDELAAVSLGHASAKKFTGGKTIESYWPLYQQHHADLAEQGVDCLDDGCEDEHESTSDFSNNELSHSSTGVKGVGAKYEVNLLRNSIASILDSSSSPLHKLDLIGNLVRGADDNDDDEEIDNDAKDNGSETVCENVIRTPVRAPRKSPSSFSSTAHSSPVATSLVSKTSASRDSFPVLQTPAPSVAGTGRSAPEDALEQLPVATDSASPAATTPKTKRDSRRASTSTSPFPSASPSPLTPTASGSAKKNVIQMRWTADEHSVVRSTLHDIVRNASIKTEDRFELVAAALNDRFLARYQAQYGPKARRTKWSVKNQVTRVTRLMDKVEGIEIDDRTARSDGKQREAVTSARANKKRKVDGAAGDGAPVLDSGSEAVPVKRQKVLAFEPATADDTWFL